MTDKEKIEKLRELINQGQDLLAQAAQFAGENNIPLRFIDDDYEEPEEGEEAEDEYDDYGYGPGMYFGGQKFTLSGYNGKYRWHNSNCY